MARRSTGVFRPVSWVPYLRRRRQVPFGLPHITPEVGNVAALGASQSTPVKRATPVGIGPAGLDGSMVARKVAAVGGSCSLGAVGSGNAVKRATPLAVAPAAVVGAAVECKVAAELGLASLGAFGDGEIVPLTASRGVVGFSGSANAVKVSAQGGSCSVGMSGAGRAVKAAPARGRAFAGPDGASTSTRVAQVVGESNVFPASEVPYPRSFNGPAVAGVDGRAQVRKVALVKGFCSVGGFAGATARKRAPKAGQVHAGFTTAGLSSHKVAPVRGRISVGLVGLGQAIVVGYTTGIRTSPPKLIPRNPIAGSKITWDAFIPPGASVTVETSVDNGASWQVATSGAPVPRLIPGTMVAKTVIHRVTLQRQSAFDPAPQISVVDVDIWVDDSREELKQLGRFTINECNISDTDKGLEIEIAGVDFSRRVSKQTWGVTYVLDEGTNYAEAIKAVVRSRLAGVTFNFETTNFTTPRIFFGEQEENDPWKDAQSMAEKCGMELFFDPMGVCTLRREPDPELGVSVWEFNDTSNAVITDLKRRVDDENTWNIVVVTGEGSSMRYPVRAIARDLDPASPTYIFGEFGPRTKRVTSPLVRSYQQAREAADGRVRKYKGASETVEISVVPNCALEPGDIITVTRPKSGVGGRFLTDEIAYPFGADESMRIVARRQRS